MVAIAIIACLLGMVVVAVTAGLSWLVGYATGIMQAKKDN